MPANRATVKTEKPSSSRATLHPGDPAPDFTLPDDAGVPVSLSQFHGKKVVLYFYPKDDTPGCTKEACSFRDGRELLARRDAVVLGISVDSVESHRKFKQKYNLPFTLLSDSDKRVVSAYGVWKEKSLYGRTYLGIERTTVIIDAEGRISRVFAPVKVDGHFDEVLAALD